jgi:hypothetical protein
MSVVKGIALVKSIIGKPGRLKSSEKATLTKVANQNNMSVTELKKVVKKEKALDAGEGTASDKAVAKREGISVAELQKRRKAAKKKKKTPKKWTRSKKERAELARLTSQQRKEALGEQFKGAGISGGRREQVVRGAEGRKGLQRPNIVESRFGRLKSKHQTPTDEWNKAEKFRQKLAPHAEDTRNVAEAMGLTGKGSLPTAAEARALGLTVKKGGGVVVDAKFGKLIKALMRKATKKKKPSTTKKVSKVKAKPKSIIQKLIPSSLKHKIDQERTHNWFKKEYKKVYGKPYKKGASISKISWAGVPKKTTDKAGKALGLQKIKQSRPKPKAKRISPLTKPKPGASPAKIKQWRIAKSQAKTPTQRVADRRKFEEKAGIKLSKQSLEMPKAMQKKKADEARKKIGLPIKKAKVGSLIKTLKGVKKPKPKPKKKTVVTKKKPVKKPTGLRSKLQGRSAKDIEKSYSSFQIEDMLTKLKQAGTPDKTLINRLNKIHRKHEAKFKAATKKRQAAERARIREIDAREALGLKKEKAMRKKEKDMPGLSIKRKKNWDDMTMEEKYAAEFPRTRKGKFAKRHPEPDPMRGAPTMPSTKKKRGKLPAHLQGPARKPGWYLSTDRKKGGAIKRNKGGAVRGVGKATRGFGNAKYSNKLY